MTFLPIVARELRVAARRRGTFWLRTGAGLALVIVGTWLVLMMHGEPPRQIAVTLFGLLTGGASLYCLLSGVQFTADCLSQEKRNGTLGLLFLTDLRGYDIVLGKLAATSLHAFYAVLAIVPLLAVPLLMGGVTLGEFGRMSLVAVNTLFFSLAVGMCVSAGCRSARTAAGATFLLIVVFAALLPAAGAWLAYAASSRGIDQWFLLSSPGYSYFLAWDMNYRRGPATFWWCSVVIHGLGWVFLALASVIVPHAWQDRPVAGSGQPWREFLQGWLYGWREKRAEHRRRLLERNPILWLSARERFKPAYVWLMLALLGAGWCWGWAKYRQEWLNEGIYVMTGVVLNLLVKGWFASECGRQLATERQEGTLELLLSTPLTVENILKGQRLALLRQFAGPVAVVLGVEFGFILTVRPEMGPASDRALWVMFWSAAMVMLVADLIGLYWVGMWQAVKARNPRAAASATAARILVLPWVVFAVVALWVSLASFRSQATPGFFLGCWFVVGIAADLLFGGHARIQLLTEFRSVAAERYLPRPGLWQRLAGREES